MKMSSLCERVFEKVISSHSRGNIQLRMVGTGLGFSYRDLERLFAADRAEWSFETPKCQRFRTWDPEIRIAQLDDIYV